MSRSRQKPQLIVASRTENLANTIQSELRNSGIQTQVHWPSAGDEFGSMLASLTPELVLCEERLKDPAVEDVIRAVRDFDPDLPVLVMGDHVTLMRTVGAIDLGARDFVSSQDMRHLTLVVRRELECYEDRRRMHSLFKRAQELEARARSLLKETGDAVLQVQEGVITEINPAFLGLLGRTTGDDALIGQPVLDIAAADDQPSLKTVLKRARKSPATEIETEIRLLGKDGVTPPVQLDVASKFVDGELVTECMVRQSALDKAFSPGSRPDLFKRLQALTPPVDGSLTALVLIYVDQFDSLEERIGYLDSDQILQHLYDMLAPVQQPGDRVFRFSVSELILLVKRSSADDTRAFADQLLDVVDQATFTTAEHETAITATIVSYPLTGEERPQTLIRDMRRNAAQVSRRGGDISIFMGPTAEASERKRVADQQAERIRAALRADQLKLVFQPIASLEGEPGNLLDTHVRMLTPDGGELMAMDFLPVAIEYELMPEIDAWVMQAAVRVLGGSGDAAGLNPTLFIRISNQTLANPQTVTSIWRDAIESGQCRSEQIVFEIGEGQIHDHRAKFAALAEALQAHGGRVAIDRFGNKRASLSLLTTLQPQFIKLDPAFTRSLESSDAEAKRQFAELIETAQSQGIRTIAEHVEDANSMAQLWQLGINYVQGNHVQSTITADEPLADAISLV